MNLFACAIGGALCERFLKKVALILRTAKQNYILDTYFLVISDTFVRPGTTQLWTPPVLRVVVTE